MPNRASRHQAKRSDPELAVGCWALELRTRAPRVIRVGRIGNLPQSFIDSSVRHSKQHHLMRGDRSRELATIKRNVFAKPEISGAPGRDLETSVCPVYRNLAFRGATVEESDRLRTIGQRLRPNLRLSRVCQSRPLLASRVLV